LGSVLVWNQRDNITEVGLGVEESSRVRGGLFRPIGVHTLVEAYISSDDAGGREDKSDRKCLGVFLPRADGRVLV
jgi:hypothetical protein